MATEQWNLRQIVVGGTNPNRLWWDSSPAAALVTQATSTTGWNVGTVAANNYQVMNAGAEVGRATFSTTVQPSNTAPTITNTYISTATYTPPHLQNASTSIMTIYPYNGYIPAGTWTFTFPVIAVSNASGQDGAITMRVYKGTGPTMTALNITALAYSSDLKIWVAGSNDGYFWISTDGIRWEWTEQDNLNAVQVIRWANGIFMAGCTGGSLFTSPDGVNWTSQTSGTTQQINGIAYSGTTWVFVAATGVVRTSTDNGVNWTTRTSGVGFNLFNVKYANGVFLAFGASNTQLIRSTNDGTTWSTITFSTAAGINLNSGDYGAFSGSPRWLLGGTAGWIIWSDDDGATWSSLDTGSNDFNSIDYDGTQWVAAGFTTATTTGQIWTLVFATTSTVTLTSRLSTTTGILNSINYNNSSELQNYVVVGNVAQVYVSTNGTSYTRTNTLTELTSPAAAPIQGTTVTNLATATAQSSVVSWTTAPIVQLNNEFIVCKIGWRITGAATNQNADVAFRYGSGCTMVTPTFQARIQNTT